MHTITLHRWMIADRDGRRRPSRYAMTEANARATDPGAEQIPGTAEVRHVPAPGTMQPGHHVLMFSGDKVGPGPAQ